MNYNNSGIGFPCDNAAENPSNEPMVGTRSVGSIGRSYTTPSRTPRAQRHHPGSARKSVAGAVMLESIAAGIVIRIAPKIRQDKQRRVTRIFRLTLDSFPNFRAQTIRPPNAVDIKRERPPHAQYRYRAK